MLSGADLEPLTSVWKADSLSKWYSPSVVSSLLVKGVPYDLSFDATYYDIVYYNIPLFQKLGIAVPTNHRIPSLSDLNSMVAKLAKAGYDGLSIGGDSGYQASWMLDSYLNTAATPAQYGNYLTSWQPTVKVTTSFDAPNSPFVQALKAIQTMGKANDFEPGYLGITQVPESEALFVAGRAGMLLDGDYSVAVLKSDNVPFKYGWMLLPPVAGSMAQNVPSLYTGDAMGVPTHASDPALGVDFLQVVMSQAAQETNVSNGSLPVTSNVPSSYFAKLGPIVQSEVAFANKYGAEIGWTSGAPGGFAQQFTDPLVQAMLGGSLTPVQVGQKVEAQLGLFRSGKD
jgi:raffinose/stachyose/melibiose transport system substrate-binding protein